ncbi:MAG: AMP nucleosidase, partial [Rhodocyclaceae bacterium]|nr:AMP nucleosidase [Rhodocyclaceae bacterium]
MDTAGSGRTLFDDPERALERVAAIYERNAAAIRESFERYVRGEYPDQRVRACYPYVSIRTDRPTRVDSRWSYGYVAGPGSYATTLTRPDLFGAYYLRQFKRLLSTHGVGLEIGESTTPIPVHFTFPEGIHVEGELDRERTEDLGSIFDLPDLAQMDDSIVNGNHRTRPGTPLPLALFTAPRVDYSLHRLKHYTGTSAASFQNLVLFTNYQFYVDEFIRYGKEIMS